MYLCYGTSDDWLHCLALLNAVAKRNKELLCVPEDKCSGQLVPLELLRHALLLATEARPPLTDDQVAGFNRAAQRFLEQAYPGPAARVRTCCAVFAWCCARLPPGPCGPRLLRHALDAVLRTLGAPQLTPGACEDCRAPTHRPPTELEVVECDAMACYRQWRPRLVAALLRYTEETDLTEGLLCHLREFA